MEVNLPGMSLRKLLMAVRVQLHELYILILINTARALKLKLSSSEASLTYTSTRGHRQDSFMNTDLYTFRQPRYVSINP